MITATSNRKIRKAIAISALLKEPFVCFYGLLSFFLIKDLGACTVQMIIYSQLRPASSLFAFYVSESISQQRISLRGAILWCGILARASFIPALLTDNVWLYVVGSTLYMVFTRAEIPAWMEVIKKNVYKKVWERAFSLGSMISYGFGAVLALLCNKQMNGGWEAHKSFFILSLLLGVVAVIYQAMMVDNDQPVEKKSLGFKWSVALPLQEVKTLMKEHKEFRHFQLAFMMGGFGLMIIQPVIPIYFASMPKILPSDVMIAFGLCKAIGFVCTTPIWNQLLKKYSPGLCVLFVLIGFSLFSFFLIYAKVSTLSIFVAYVIFGIAQGGSHLIWHLSGPIFSKEKSSARFSAVNVVMVGVRGVIGPALGGALLLVFDPQWIFALSMVLCLVGALFYLLISRETIQDGLFRHSS